jgi:L-threonylcarbamoyladenylate synthase
VAPHYSPGLPARFFEKESDLQVNLSRIDVENYALIEVVAGSLKSVRSLPCKKIIALGKNQNEAAQNIFQILRQLGSERIQGFVAVAGPETGLGLALNDRLRRAAGKG